MRIFRVIVTAFLLGSLGACGSLNSESDTPVNNGMAIVAGNTVTKDSGTSIHLGGKTFHITKELVTWDRGGSLKLSGNWGLLELREAAGAVEINLDGVVVKTVAK